MKSRWNSVSQETSPAAQTSDPPASAFLERRPLKQEGSLDHPLNDYEKCPDLESLGIVLGCRLAS
jgi:hypothetical protein